PGATVVRNSTTYPNSALGRVGEGRGFNYEHDQARATSLLAEAGWQKGPDGVLTKAGERFRLQYRSGAANADAALIFPVLEQQYKRLGMEFVLDTSSSTDLEADAKYPGLVFTALPDNQTVFLPCFN